MAKARVQDGGSNSGQPIAVGKKAYTGPGKRFGRSGIKPPAPNTSNTYGITNQKANVKSAVTGPTSVGSRNLPDNQGALTRKAPRQVC
jgi:hypothetical protein